MTEYSKEKVLEWVSSSEAKAAKYEQEAKVSTCSYSNQLDYSVLMNGNPYFVYLMNKKLQIINFDFFANCQRQSSC